MLQIEIDIVKKEGQEELCSPVILISQEGSEEIIPIGLPRDIKIEDGLRLYEVIKRIIMRDYKTIEQVKRDYYNN